MRRIALFAIIAVFSQPLIVLASFFTGANLNEWGHAHDRIAAKRDTAGDFTNSAMLSGYVIGVADLGDKILFCTPSNSTVGQLVAVTLKYLREHPEKWSLPADEVVTQALRNSFPCKK